MARRQADYYPQRTSVAVRGKSADGRTSGNGTGIMHVQLGSPLAADATAILAAQSIAVAGTASVFAAAYTNAMGVPKVSEPLMSKYGRNVTIVGSGAATSSVTVTGRDFLGQRMSETLTLNGTTTVQGVKAFRYVDAVQYAATAAVTINVGVGNVLGLPTKFQQLDMEMKNGVVAANAGTFQPGLLTSTPATATNADVRGTYLPVTVLPNGVNVFELRYIADETNLEGNVQFAA